MRSSRFSTMTRLPPGNGTEYPLTPCLDARKNPRLRETLESKSLRASEIGGLYRLFRSRVPWSRFGNSSAPAVPGQNKGVKPFSPHGPAFLSGRLHMFRQKY